MEIPFVPPSFGDKSSFELKFTRARDLLDVQEETPDAKTVCQLILPLMTRPDSIVMSYGVIQKTFIKELQQDALMVQGMDSPLAQQRMYGTRRLDSEKFFQRQ